RHATVSGTPGFDDANVQPAGLGFYRIAFTVSDGGFGAATAVTALIISNTNRAPTLNPIPNTTLCGGAVADQGISGSDPDGDALTFSKVAGPFFMTVTTSDSTIGNIHLAPPVSTTSGSFGATVRADDGHFGSADQSFTITIICGNRCPRANAGGPYSGLANVPLTMNGSASSDPDGNPLTYAWDFDASDGITVEAVGAIVSHTYAAVGTFTATLAVTDNGNGDPAQACSATATTVATIADACGATVFNGYDTIRLGAGKPYWFGYVQPAASCYANTDVSIASFVMKYAGRQISAASSKTTVGGDKNGDGIQEIKVSFTKDDLRTLFAGTGLPNGHSTVTVVIEAGLATGGLLRGSTQLDIVNNGSFTISAVAPNPLNPSATLTYTTTRSGAVRIDMFDIQGRLVRSLVDDPAMAAGLHETTIDGRGQHGEKLSSGVYYIRGVSSEGVFQHLVTILK
ncbi:MAG TPA: PKD domain-containing protein, partial [Candidatus Binatia bacterium]|nr:PKD domain-containing protein [Candidatus Binatia bacterium]